MAVIYAVGIEVMPHLPFLCPQVILKIAQIALILICAYVPGVQFVFQSAAPPVETFAVPTLIGGMTITLYNMLRQIYIRRQPKTSFARSMNW